MIKTGFQSFRASPPGSPSHHPPAVRDGSRVISTTCFVNLNFKKRLFLSPTLALLTLHPLQSTPDNFARSDLLLLYITV